MKTQHKIFQYLLDKLPTSLLVLMALLVLASGYQFSQWWKAHQLNLAYNNKSLLKQPLKNDEYLKAYSIGYLLASQNKPIEAAKAFNIAEVSLDPELRARAKYAIANVHFESAMASSDIEHGGSHRPVSYTHLYKPLSLRMLLKRLSYQAQKSLSPCAIMAIRLAI